MGTAVQQTARPYSGPWTQLQRSSVPLSPPSWTFSLHDAPVKLPVSWKNPTHPSHSLFQLLPSGRRYQSIRARSARLLNSFSPNHLTPLWNLIHNPSSWNQDPPPPHPTTPQHMHHMKTFKNLKNIVQFWVCYTQVSGLDKPPVGTHSFSFSLHAPD